MNYFSKNLRFLRTERTLGINQFESLGIKKGTMSNYELGKTEPKFETLQRLSKFFGVSIDDFINQDIEKLKKNNSLENGHTNGHIDSHLSEKNGNSKGKKYTPKYTPEENIQVAEKCSEYTSIRLDSLKNSSFAVPFYDIPVSAGPLGVLTYSWDAVKPDGYIDMEIFRRCDAILPVIGVSMEPEIHSGDLIGIRKLEYYNWEYIETGKVYMIITHEDRMIKYINKADDSDYIVCSSPNYHDFKIRKADVLEVYRVVANIRAL